jgi:hypothetical protein
MTGLELGGGGSNISIPSDVTTFTWMTLPDKSKFSYSAHLPWLSDLADFQGRSSTILWLKAQLAEGTVRSTISHVLQTFWEKGR